ncbi:MAG TPA: hypothetical protein VF721_15890 [Pyrinomonadaceae bacterium]|jgi:hypothetical protein
MKKVLILSLLLLTFALISEAKAQAPKRIQFAKGRTAATVKGNTGAYGVVYFVRAKSGQKLILSLTPASKVGIKVSDGRYGEMVLLRQERGGSYEVGLEESGDYTIFVGSTGGKSVPFALTVKITNMTDI